MKSKPSFLSLLVVTLLLGTAGFLGNWFKLPLFFNVDFLFGSFFVMLAIARCGVPSAVASGLIAASCSYLLWNHPWAIIIFSAEVLFVALCNRRKAGYLLLYDALYWLCIGMPLVWFFYHVVMHIPLQATLLVALKQSINGIINALLATLALSGFRLLKPSDDESRVLMPLREIIFTAVVTVTLLPSITYMILNIRESVRTEEARLSARVQTVAENSQEILNTWLSRNHQTVIALSKIVGDPDRQTFSSMQRQLEDIKLSNNDILRLGIIDKNAFSAGYLPLYDESGTSTIGINFSERPHVAILKKNLKPLVPDVVMSKLTPPIPVLPLLAPIVIDGRYCGYSAGIVDFNKLSEQLRILVKGRNTNITVLDRNGNVVISTNKNLSSLQRFERPLGGQQRNLINGVYHWVPKPAAKTSIMQRWKSSLFVKELTLNQETPWTIVAESSLLPFLTALNEKTIKEFLQLWAILLLILATAHLLGKSISDSLNRLAQATSELPQKLATNANLQLPVSKIEELHYLNANFRDVTAALGASFRDLRTLNEQLEQRVNERTSELGAANELLEREAAQRKQAQEELASKHDQLEAINAQLQERIDAAISELRQKDQVMISQGRQASMGEMIGNIAHQWRQPLNALSMVIGNIRSAYQYNELTAEYLDKSVENGNRLIQKMSTTINDFRNFFKPDKEAIAFSARDQISHAVALVEAGLIDQNISVIQETPVDVVFRGFPNEFSQVLLNLLSNARDAIKDSGVAAGCITISLQERNDIGYVAVRDNGGGVPSEVLDKIFEPYFSTKQMGTGIGLYMSKMIIERSMNGTIETHNIAGGAEFVIVTPLEGRRV